MNQNNLYPLFRDILIFSLLITLFVYVALDEYNAMSCVLGSLVSGINLLLLYWSWRSIFRKKSIAIAVSVIVIKYALLGYLLYYLVANEKVSVLGLLVGFSVGLLALTRLSVSYVRSLNLSNVMERV